MAIAIGFATIAKKATPQTKVAMTGIIITGIRPTIHFGSFQVFIHWMK